MQKHDATFRSGRIAVFGAGEHPRRAESAILGNLVGGGFRGAVYSVPPMREVVRAGRRWNMSGVRLVEFLERERERVLTEAVLALSRWRLAHYEADGEALLKDRLGRFYDAVTQAVSRRSLTAVERHIEALASERFQAGYELREVQTAFNVLEEVTWGRLVAEFRREDLPEALGMIATVIGLSKDALARAYLGLAARVGAPAADLDALARGVKDGWLDPEE